MIYNLYSTQDSTIYEAMPTMNAGLDEVLELNKNVTSDTLIEVSRILIKFNVSKSISELVRFNNMPTSSFNAMLTLYTLSEINTPIEFSVDCFPIYQQWSLGTGKTAYFPEISNGVSWQYSTETDLWQTGSLPSGVVSEYFTVPGGGNWYTGSKASQEFIYSPTKTDIKLDVTNIVNQWLSGSIQENGFLLKVNSSYEYTTNTYGPFNFFSSETDSIYSPILTLGWDDSVYNTGSLNPLSTDRFAIIVKNLNKFYNKNTISTIRVISRPLFPIRTFSTGSSYNIVQYLPITSYYGVSDYYTGELIVPFSDYTKLSCDSYGNYFNFNFNILEKNRYYRFEFKVYRPGYGTLYFMNDEIFNVF